MKRSLHVIVLLSVLLSLVLLSPVAAQDDNPLTRPVQILVPEVLSVMDRDPSSYTQGFLLYDGSLFESAGLYGKSQLREVDPATGEVLRSIEIPEQYFAEGLERVGDQLIQLTWKENTAFVYDLETFERTGEFAYEGEGWGLCTDGKYLYMSNGTPFIAVRDPETFEVVFNGLVTVQGSPVDEINELECVGDYIYANIWKTNYIIQIDKLNGVVVGIIDASTLLTEEEKAALSEQQVLNGIAYNPETETFLITGKQWPKIFEVRFVPAEQ
jgi:glutaminyl-peptide cyclotransferase